ncbi:MAG TPA: hypothetical protein VGF34_13810 [Stellaceae bacterium]
MSSPSSHQNGPFLDPQFVTPPLDIGDTMRQRIVGFRRAGSRGWFRAG